MASENRPPTKNKRRQRPFTADCDLCDQVVDCYTKSIAPQHVNLCAIAKATRSIIDSEPRTPIAYYDTIVNSLSSASKTHDDIQGLSLLLQIVLPLLPKKAITASKAADAAEIVIEALKVSRGSALVECLGVLLSRCALGKWVVSLELGIKTLIEYSIDKRQKVRECAQQCAVNVFNSIEEKAVRRSASELLIDSFTRSMSLALDESASDPLSHSSVDSVLHLLDMLRILIPCLRPMYAIKAIKALEKPMASAKPPMVMRRALDFMELILRYCEIEPQPTEITFSIGKDWISVYSTLLCRIADLLRSDEVTTAARASTILKAKIKRVCLFVCLYKDEPSYGALEKMVSSLWLKLEEVVNTHTNEYSLSVMAVLYDDFGFCPDIYLERILLKVAKSMISASGDIKKHIQECIGSAVAIMGPEKVLDLLPISVKAARSCDNTWLIRIFKDYVIRSSLGFFIERIVPLAKSFQKECQKEESPVIREQLESHAHGCWGLLPAFCHHPTDMHENFGPLVKLLVPYIERADAFVLESIAIAMEHLVKRNKNISFVSDDKASKLWKIRYDEETASENIKTMSSWSEELLKAFTQRFFREKSPPAFLKETIRCLALVTDSQKVNAILLENLSIDDTSEPSNEHDLIHVLSPPVPSSRFIGTNNLDSDRDDIIYRSIKKSFQAGVEDGKAFTALNKVLLGSSKFMSSKFEQVMILLFGLDPVVDATSLKLLFSCYKTLFLHSMEIYCDAKNDYGTHILYRIIVEPKDDESKELAHGILKETSSMLQSGESSSPKPGNHYVFITMIMWFLFKSPPDITSAAVYALTSLITHDSKILYSVPDLVPSVLELLDTEDSIQVIKAVLGFISSLHKSDMHHFQDDILAGLRPWSTVSHPSTNLKVNGILDDLTRNPASPPTSPIDFSHLSREEDKKKKKKKSKSSSAQQSTAKLPSDSRTPLFSRNT